MLQLQKTLRCSTSIIARATSNVTSRSYSKDYDSSDDEKTPKKKKDSKPKKPDASPEQESAASKLNRLLASMQTEDNFGLTNKAINMAKPGEGAKKRKEAMKQEAKSKDIFAAAKNVASMLNKDEGEEGKKQIESELLAKLLGVQFDKGAPSDKKDGGTSSSKPVEELNLSEIIVGMKIDRSSGKEPSTRAEYVRRSLNTRTKQGSFDKKSSSSGRSQQRKLVKREPENFTGSVNLFGSEPLGIFTETEKLNRSENILKTWSHLEKRDLQLHVTHPPANYFEKIALWTEQGKVWKFPINNEQDWTEEIDVDFTKHIFLEQHLEPWCPSKGPIRHFMELVCVGLSKNPYITAKEKEEHILWYRDYFMAKKDILKDLIAEKKLEQTSGKSKKSEKQVQA